MKKESLLNRILASGLWLQPIIMAVIIKYLQMYNPEYLKDWNDWMNCFLVSLIPAIYIWAEMLGNPSERTAMLGKDKAMYPKIPKEMLYKEPTGVILGQDKRTGHYVCKRLEEDGHIFLIGGSGSGKSSAYVIPTLLINKNARIMAIDIKGELSYKTTKYGNQQVLIFDPSDRNKYGYDPFYNLNEKSSVQQILETMQTITYSLISLPANLRDPFWKNSARNLLLGLLIFYYKQGIADFISIIDEILGKPVKENIEKVMATARYNSVEYRYIVQFKGMGDETLSGIVAEMNNHIVVFSNDQDIRYAFKENACKVSPMKLEEGYSIYLSIKEEKLSAYYDVLQLIVNQTLNQLEKRPEDSEPIIFVIDELPRILSAGKLDRLLDGVRTLRSRKVCLYLITQSIEALASAYTENEVTDLISNCPYIIVLSASSSKTQKSVCAWCGKYKVRKTSWNGAAEYRKTSITYEEKDIVDPSELITLKNSGEAILITPYGYSRVLKTPYYKDKILKPIAEEIVAYNKTINKM